MEKYANIGSTERKYLLAVYLTLNEMGWTRLKRISSFLNVKMPSAKQFLEKLVEMNLIYYEHRGGISLTQEGKKLAIIENTRFNAVKTFFCEILQLDEKESNEAAWNVYFNLNDKVVNKFSEFARFLVEDEGKKIVEEFRTFLSQPRKKTAPCPISSAYEIIEKEDSTGESNEER
ncbi:MAG: metal-dependent transcriptional regulator [Fervidobacterium sp.]|nr:metal-dependent transcriptional regulator [Fervidobacterium sp.]